MAEGVSTLAEQRKAGAGGSREILRAEGLVKHFTTRRGAFSRPEALRAVDGVDFAVGRNRVFSIVGESGCGKSTVARLLLRLLDPTAGRVLHAGRDVGGLDRASMLAFRRAVQIVFQDPFASLNPRRTVYETIAEPMKIHGLAKRREVRDRVVELLETVGMSDVLGRYPHEFSGGQRQRICIARALAVSPELIVADEPLSALDVSIQAQIINLLVKLKEERGLSYVLISHDIRMVRYLSDEVAVMYLGRIVEQAGAEEIFGNPSHPYTQILLTSAPEIDPSARGRERTILGGEVPSPIDVPTGCPFHPRCPKRFEPCAREIPALKDNGSGHLAACHLIG